MNHELEMNALDAIIAGGMQLTKEAMERKADIKQGRLASESMGRVNAACKTKLDYHLNRMRLAEIDRKFIEQEKADLEAEKPGSLTGASRKRIESQKNRKKA